MLKIIPLFLLLFNISCFEDKKENNPKSGTVDLSKFEEARIKTVHGDIVIEFFPKSAPNTVTRIKQLISEGFYNGLIFHRVIPGFVVQGGDPTGTGMHGSGKKLKAEFNDKKTYSQELSPWPVPKTLTQRTHSFIFH
jgi:hypothetical protein